MNDHKICYDNSMKSKHIEHKHDNMSLTLLFRLIPCNGISNVNLCAGGGCLCLDLERRLTLSFVKCSKTSANLNVQSIQITHISILMTRVYSIWYCFCFDSDTSSVTIWCIHPYSSGFHHWLELRQLYKCKRVSKVNPKDTCENV